jgi:hypothetical protein
MKPKYDDRHPPEDGDLNLPISNPEQLLGD